METLANNEYEQSNVEKKCKEKNETGRCRVAFTNGFRVNFNKSKMSI